MTQKRPPPSPTTSSATRDAGPLYQGGLGSAFANTSRSTPSFLLPMSGRGGGPAGMGLGMGVGMGMGMGMALPYSLGMGIGSRAPPPTLGMSFPAAVAYSSLAPSNFVGAGMGDPRRMGIPLDPSGFAPPTWQVPPTNAVPSASARPPPAAGSGSGSGAGPGSSVSPAPSPGGEGPTPTTLETTDDLVRYLEHRARMTAGQTDDSDFMMS